MNEESWKQLLIGSDFESKVKGEKWNVANVDDDDDERNSIKLKFSFEVN